MGSCYNCGQGGISGGNGFCDDNCESEYTDYVKADQADNQAAARALSQTIQSPPDRGGDTSRQFQGGSVMRWNTDPSGHGDTYSLPLGEDMTTREAGQHIARVASASGQKPHNVRNVSPSDASKNCYMCGDDDNTDVCDNCAGDIQEQQREPR